LVDGAIGQQSGFGGENMTIFDFSLKKTGSAVFYNSRLVYS